MNITLSPALAKTAEIVSIITGSGRLSPSRKNEVATHMVKAGMPHEIMPSTVPPPAASSAVWPMTLSSISPRKQIPPMTMPSTAPWIRLIRQ